MAIEVDTKDCTALSDAELGEMADICTGGIAGFIDKPATVTLRGQGEQDDRVRRAVGDGSDHPRRGGPDLVHVLFAPAEARAGHGGVLALRVGGPPLVVEAHCFDQ